ncbi:MAG: DNA replication protein [Alphaproteobacteria bacterium]|nr:DNA replication protein [Alphaproteobacteria bacterium]
MSEQLALDFPSRPAFGRTDFWVAPCNQEAIAWIDKYPRWPMRALLIYGEAGSGKTHLAAIFSDERIEAQDLTEDFLPQGDKIVVENLEGLKDEKALFHLFNRVHEMGGGLLMTAKSVPQFKLPDLQSRIGMIPKAEIQMPDDQTIMSVCAKMFADKQAIVEPSVLMYIVTRVPRSFDAIRKVVNTADELSLANGRRITIYLIKEAIEKLTQNGGLNG